MAIYKRGTVKVGLRGYPTKEWIAFLPHSCDEWEIGDAGDVKRMIADLQEALKELESKGNGLG